MLRPATDADSATLLEWRNQPANRAVSRYQYEITVTEHERWWTAVRADPTRQVLVFEHEGRALGAVTFFDIKDKSASWGFYLDSDTVAAEGIALMAWIQVMRDATTYAFDELRVDLLTGEVKDSNEAVRLMNRRLRFTEGEPCTTEDGRVFLPISLRREDRRLSKEDK